ncbi:MAG: YigZ family protein [Melioribacteraceae bacterium]|nr:YigZ family protein [Melioribacteraceae bacterium]
MFIGYAAPCKNDEEAEQILEGKKKQYYDATHNCYAYKILPESIKYLDDGEPSGTAGIRILNAIQHFDLTNLIVISTRYFGGTKLGVGPLGKAYYNSALLYTQRCKDYN